MHAQRIRRRAAMLSPVDRRVRTVANTEEPELPAELECEPQLPVGLYQEAEPPLELNQELESPLELNQELESPVQLEGGSPLLAELEQEHAVVEDKEPGRIKSGALSLLVHVALFLGLMFGVSWETREVSPVVYVDLWSGVPGGPGGSGPAVIGGGAPAGKPAEIALPAGPTRPPSPPAASHPVIRPPTEPAPQHPPTAKPLQQPDIPLAEKEGKSARKLGNEAEDFRRDEELLAGIRQSPGQGPGTETAVAREDAGSLAGPGDRFTGATGTGSGYGTGAGYGKGAGPGTGAGYGAGTGGGPGGVAGWGAAGALTTYLSRIVAVVKSNTYVPPEVSGNPEVVYQVTLLPSGDIRDVRLVKSSGVASYDASAERAIRKSSPLPVPTDDPALFEQRFHVLTLHFRPRE